MEKIVFEDWYEVSGLVTVVSLKYRSVRVGTCLVGAGRVDRFWESAWFFGFFVFCFYFGIVYWSFCFCFWCKGGVYRVGLRWVKGCVG